MIIKRIAGLLASSLFAVTFGMDIIRFREAADALIEATEK